MVKVGKSSTKQELLNDIYGLRQRILDLEMKIIRLKQQVHVNPNIPYVVPAPYQPPIFRDPCIYPFIPSDADADDGGTGDPLPVMPHTVCSMV
ncbi:hypothetical protein LCGC14_0611210 [marine sediment metagenome]|uniref:Uncharacterized protein n=1 Tax=marine sediment metagenome TaxID=412755 RepID=A0A0F9RCA1_9ZZZZ